MAKIRILNGPYRGRERSLSGAALTIGRDAEAGLQVLDRSASRFHCEVFPVGDMWFVRDLDSKNGTFVNDERLQDEELLRYGDIIKIGATELIFEAGSSLQDESSDSISYVEDAETLGNTIEFRIDDLADVAEPEDEALPRAEDPGKGVRILYQAGRVLAESEAADRESRVLQILIQQLPAECAVVFRRDEASGKLVPTTVRVAASGIQPVISRSIVRKTFAENKAVHTVNAMEDPRFADKRSVTSKQVRSVICVPLAVNGVTRGVVYLSRGAQDPPFDHGDLELVSAISLQLAQMQAIHDERRRARTALVQTVAAMIRTLELRAACLGAGERCARAAAAVAVAQRLPEESRDRLYFAGLLHHFPRLAGDAAAAERALATIDELHDLIPLIRCAYERVDGRGPLRTAGEELDTEARILAAAAAFTARLAADPGADPADIIEQLLEDPGFDRAVVRALAACHLNGSLYRAPAVPGAEAPRRDS
ncbi:MAG: FHA domain-containing protein [Planctomycetota bacterium]|nr:FHA domain-containing protein [Planctomycetota bacterium]MCX8039741.1 FHA domain-containing protein [Planctomycetota bacterium]MDW8373233.1 FHA domain-containing protein [Planctomycetota bacterium]